MGLLQEQYFTLPSQLDKVLDFLTALSRVCADKRPRIPRKKGRIKATTVPQIARRLQLAFPSPPRLYQC